MPRHPWGWPKVVTTPIDFAICLRYQEICGDGLAFSCECAGDGCPDQPTPTLAARRGTAETGDDDE